MIQSLASWSPPYTGANLSASPGWQEPHCPVLGQGEPQSPWDDSQSPSSQSPRPRNPGAQAVLERYVSSLPGCRVSIENVTWEPIKGSETEREIENPHFIKKSSGFLSQSHDFWGSDSWFSNGEGWQHWGVIWKLPVWIQLHIPSHVCTSSIRIKCNGQGLLGTCYLHSIKSLGTINGSSVWFYIFLHWWNTLTANCSEQLSKIVESIGLWKRLSHWILGWGQEGRDAEGIHMPSSDHWKF